MKKYKSNCVRTFSSIVMMAILLGNVGCSNLESDQSVDPLDASIEAAATTSSVGMNKLLSGKCTSASQEINDRWDAYVETFNEGDVDEMYSFWTPEFHNSTDDSDRNRDEMRAHMITSFANGTKIDFTWQLLEQNVFGDAAYNIGAYHNDATLNGTVYTNNGYYFSRMIKGDDGVWLIDKNIGGYFDNKSVVDPNAEGAVACYGKQAGGNGMTDQQITNQSNAYAKALTSGNADEVSKFWTDDIHFYGEGLDEDRDGLYQYYRQFFQTGSILTSNNSLKYRYMHGNVIYDIGQSEDTVIINGVQSIKKHNYIIRWEKGHDKVWRISRLMNLHRD